MVAKLKLIIERIPWFLLAKAGFVALTWYLAPFWFFAFVALLIYLFPLFRPLSTGLVFLVFLWFAATLPLSWACALILGGVFLLIMGIKDLVFIRRGVIYDILLCSLGILFAYQFFVPDQSIFNFSALLGSLIFLIVGFYLLYQRVRMESSSSSETVGEIEGPRFSHSSFLPAITILILWQALWALLFVPFNFVFQIILFSLGCIILIRLGRAYLRQTLSSRAILFHFSLFFVCMVFMLALTEWVI